MDISTYEDDELEAQQSQKEVVVNENFLALANPAILFGRRRSGTTGLTWGFFGGRVYINGTATLIAEGTVALTASNTNYVEADHTGAVTKNTSAFTAGRYPLYKVVCGGSTITSWEDHRDYSNLNKVFPTPTNVNQQVGTSYTAAIVDTNGIVEMSNGSANTFEIPPNASIPFPIGTAIVVIQTDTGTTTVSPGSGVTINYPATKTDDLAEQYAAAVVIKVATNTWRLDGNLAAAP